MSSALFFPPSVPILGPRGLPAGAAKVYFYYTNTTTLAPIYGDVALAVPLANPVETDALGLLPSIYLNTSITYRYRALDVLGAVLVDIDPYVPGVFYGLSTPGTNGINGGIGSSAGFAALFSAAPGMAIGVGITEIRTAGYSAAGKGGAKYIYDAAVNSAFVTAHPGWSFLAGDGRGFRLSEEQIITFEMFGAHGDSDRFSGGGTDDYPQWLIAKDFIQTYKRTHGNAYYKSVPPLYLSRYDYRSSQYWDLTEGVYVIKGAGPNAQDRGGNTAIVFDSGQCGIILQSWNTTGVTGTTTNTPKGSAYTLIEDIDVFSMGGTVGANQHGFLLKAPATLNRCGAYNFGGHGFFPAADVTYAGNANCGKMYGCKAMYNGMSGLATRGGDSNAWEIVGFNAINNGMFGIDEQSFLGNHYYGYHTAGNGNAGSGPTWATTRPTAGAALSGHYYRVVPGQQVAASTTSPSGTTASNAVWSYQGDGAPTSVFPAWVNGNSYVSGGAFYLNGASNKSGVFGGYMESDQSPGWSDCQRALILCGGFSGFQGGAQLNAHGGRIWSPGIGTMQNPGDGIELVGKQFQIGANCYFEQIDSETMNLRGPLGGSFSLTRNGGSHQHPYSLVFQGGSILGATNGGYSNTASAMPTTGTYNQGAWIRNIAGTISGGKVLLGWYRLTTGSAHVAGTDWTTIYGTTT